MYNNYEHLIDNMSEYWYSSSIWSAAWWSCVYDS